MILGSQEVRTERRADGAVLLRAKAGLSEFPRKITEKLEYWAQRAPDRIVFAQRNASGGWRSVTYAQALAQARAIGAFLISKGLSAERPLVVLSGNDIEPSCASSASCSPRGWCSPTARSSRRR
jgi:feruloyl-CoA synthase